MNFLFKNSPRGPPTPCKVSPTAKAYETLVIWPLVSCLYSTLSSIPSASDTRADLALGKASHAFASGLSTL